MMQVNKRERRIDLFVDEINKGVEVEGEEKMFIGGTEGFMMMLKIGLH